VRGGVRSACCSSGVVTFGAMTVTHPQPPDDDPAEELRRVVHATIPRLEAEGLSRVEAAKALLGHTA
jgi:hypothetical protein